MTTAIELADCEEAMIAHTFDKIKLTPECYQAINDMYQTEWLSDADYTWVRDHSPDCVVDDGNNELFLLDLWDDSVLVASTTGGCWLVPADFEAPEIEYADEMDDE